ncbi:hypothetical protein CF326_g10085, partial [Tilletia indica]
MKVIFLGATSGCGLFGLLNLIQSMKTGEKLHQAFILARRPDEFRSTLVDTHNVNPALLEKNLFIVKGDATVLGDVTSLFQKAAREEGGAPVDAIVSSVGGKLIFGSNPLKAPKLSPSNICQDATKVLLEAINAEFPANSGKTQPRIVVITSNGIGPYAHAKVPFMLKGMYSWMLDEPHADKEV